MSAILTYSPIPYVPASCLRDADSPLRQAPRRFAGHAATHPVPPLKGLPGTRATDVSYRALAPVGAGFCYQICTGTSESRPTAHYSLLTAHSPYTFSAKEKDSETDLSYFGSRYYSSDLSVWLSVDPMSDKYASLSPYVYCADNPVKLVDPDGEKIWIHDEEGGSVANAYYQELVKWASSENINLSLGTDGYLNASFDGEYFDLSDEARNFLHAVYNPNITVDIMATTNDYGDNDYAFFCGTYKGVVYGYSKGEEVAHSYQVVNPNDLRQFDEYHQQPGQTSLHELMESYNAA